MRGCQIQLRTGWLVACCTAIFAVAVATISPRIYGIAQESPAVADAPIQLSADWSQEWTEDGTTIALFRGSCRVVQGDQVYTANSMVVWAHGRGSRSDRRSHVTVYLEDGVELQGPTETRSEQSLWVDLASNRGMSLSVKGRVPNRPGKDDPLYRRAVDRTGSPTRTTLRQTQLTIPAPVDVDPSWRNVPLEPQAGLRRVRVSPRSIAMPFNIQSEMSYKTTPPEQITLITGGVNVVVDGMTVGGQDGSGAIDLSADRVIIWTEASESGQFSPEMLQRPEQSFQLYLEGNIVIRRQSLLPQLGGVEVNNVIRATRAFYDARENRALILDADLQTYIPSRDVTFRIRAQTIRQDSLKSYHAQNAWFTTSELGYPGYRVQANDLYLEPRPTGSGTQVDPTTGQLIPRESYWVTAQGTQFLAGDIPLAYVPQVSTPIEDPGVPLTGLQIGQDRIFGTQIRSKWDAHALFGLQRPEGMSSNLNLLVDYLSYRGPALGASGKYSGVDQWGNRYSGGGIKYYVHDGGVDNLGLDRRTLVPENVNRGIFEWNHTHNFDAYNMKLLTEIGVASDRNVRESFFEKDFDTGKDLDVMAYLRQKPADNWTWSLLVQPTVNYFENNTAWLPRGDLNSLGVPLLGDYVNWSQHTSLAYAALNQATAPTNPQDTFTPLPYYTDANGMVTMTRHELDAPFNLGPLKLSPYVLGEAAYWSDSFTNQSIDRLYGRGGVRASLHFWRAFPHIQSDILNLNGLAHKVTLDADYGYAQASRSLDEIPQWNQFEDNAQERFRERFITNTFNGTLPPQFDPRFYAVRSQSATSVSAPYNELVDTQQALRLGISQRLQTKVGPPDRQRIKDWMLLDLGISYFPNPNRDNFGQNFGLFSGHYVWNVGDRTSVIADSMYDFFEGGQQWWNLGVMSQRSFRGSAYVGVQQIKGATLDSKILTGSYSYTMSPKWVSTMSASYDIAAGQSRGQSLTITRVGEWMLFHLGANYDWSKNNAGFIFSIEPKLGRAGSTTQLGSLIQNPAQR
ncbi:MAG: hypothetical protein JWP89_5917 [Schlesneria sp.]|nr:hypothetical protein [Schlesneria sp.]